MKKSCWVIALSAGIYILFVAGVFLPLFVGFFGELSSLSVFSSRRFEIMLRTVIYSGIVALLATFIGLLISGIAILQRKYVWLPFVVMIAFIALPAYVHGLGWMTLAYQVFGIPVLSGMGISIFVQVMYFLPITMGISYIGIKLIDQSYFHVAVTVEATTKAFFRTVWRMNGSITAGLAIFVFVICVNDYTIPSIFAFNTYPIEIMTIYARGRDFAEAFMAMVPMMLLSGLLMFLAIRLMTDRELPYGLSYEAFKQVESSRPLLLFIFASVFCLQVILPFAFMLRGLDHPSEVWQVLVRARGDMVFSFSSSGLAAVAMVCVGSVLAYSAWLNESFRKILALLMILQLSLPGTLIGLAVLETYENMGDRIYYSPIPTAHVYFLSYLPVAYFILRFAYLQFDVTDLYALRLNTSRHLDLLTKVVLPNIKGYLSVALLFTAVLSFSELSGCILTVPPGASTMTITIYNYLHYGSGHVVLGLVMAMLVIYMTLTAIGILLIRKI